MPPRGVRARVYPDPAVLGTGLGENIVGYGPYSHLSIDLIRDRDARTLSLSQEKYISDFVPKFVYDFKNKLKLKKHASPAIASRPDPYHAQALRSLARENGKRPCRQAIPRCRRVRHVRCLYDPRRRRVLHELPVAVLEASVRRSLAMLSSACSYASMQRESTRSPTVVRRSRFRTRRRALRGLTR